MVGVLVYEGEIKVRN